MKPQQIATKLKKPVSWVCDRLKSEQVRSVIKEDTSEISSSALSQLRNLPEETINEIIPEIKSKGGTVKNTKEIVDLLKGKTKEKDPYINKPENKDPFEKVYDGIRLLMRLDIDKKVIINTIMDYIGDLK